MRRVLDSDVLVHALRIPKREDLYALHEKASNLFGSCIERKNELFLPTVIPIEVGTVLSKILPQGLASPVRAYIKALPKEEKMAGNTFRKMLHR